MINKAHYKKYIILYILFFVVTEAAFAQSNSISETSFKIEYISQYPNSKLEKNKKGITGRLIDLFFGKEQYVLRKPISIYAKDLNHFWILDQANGIVFEVKDNVGYMPKFSKKKIGEFASLIDFCSLSKQKLLFTDSQLNKVFQIYDNNISEFVTIDTLKHPTGITYVKKNNTIWIVETSKHRVLVLDTLGNTKKIIGGRGNADGKFNFPTSIYADNKGVVYVVDAMNFRIQMFSEDGDFISKFGELGDATGYFSRPKGIAADSYGHIYIADALFNTVQIFDKKGNFLFQFGKQGRGESEFWMPSGIFIDSENMIYVADSYNSRIQIFKLVLNENN